jgi:hypothetical protein
MNLIITKKLVLNFSGIYVLYFLALAVTSFVCNSSWCRIHDADVLGVLFFVFMPLLPVFFFTLITYRMRQQVFDRWISFAVWATPLLIVLTYLINSEGQQNGLGIEGPISASFDALLYFILYGLYFVISLLIIFRANRVK